MASPPDVTALLRRWQAGEDGASDELMPLIYDELRRVARRHLRRERLDHTLQPTALVHEAYLRLAGGGGHPWQHRLHFFATAAQVMRRVLVDHARARHAEKRGGGRVRLSLDESPDLAAAEPGADIVALDEALVALAALDPRKARLIELRYFGGLSLEDTARVLKLAVPTVVREARMARAWLGAQLRGNGNDGLP